MRPLLFFTVFLISLTGWAQVKNIDLNQALVLAKENNQDIQMAKRNIKKMQMKSREALSHALPNVSYNSQLDRYDKRPNFGGFYLNRVNEYSNSVTVSQPLFTFGVVKNGLDSASLALEASKLKTQDLQKEIEYLVKVTFYNAIFAKESLKIANESLDNAQKNVETLTSYFGRGRAPQADLIKLQADVAAREAQVVDAQRRLEIAKIQLAQLIGLEESQAFQLFGDLSVSLVEHKSQNMQYSVEDSYKISAMQKSVQLQSKLANIEWAKMLPSIGAYYTYSYKDRSNEKIFGRTDRLTTSVFGLKLQWNIWDGGGQHSRYRQALMEKNIQEIKLAKEKRDLKFEVSEKLSNAKKYQENIKALDKTIRLAQNSLHLSRRRFHAGKASVSELNDAERLLTQSKVNRAGNLYNIIASYAFVEKFNK